MATEQPKDLSVRLKLSDANELLDELKEIVKGAESVDDAIIKLIETIQAWASISGAAATAVQESFSRVASAIQAFGTDTKTVLDGVTAGLEKVGSTPIDIQLPEIDVDFTEQIQSQLEKLATSTSGLDNFSQKINTIIQTLQRLATETGQPFEQIAQRFLQTSERLGTLDSDTRTFVSNIVTNLQRISEVKLESSNIDEYKNSLNQLVTSVQQLQFGEINTDPIVDSLRNLADVSGQSLEQVKNDFIEAVGGLENLDTNTQQIVSRVIENLGKIEQIKPTIGEIDTTAIADVQVKLQELVESATQLEKIKDKTTLVSTALQELSQQSGIPINELGNKFLQLVNQLDNLDTATRDSLNNIVSNIQKVGETELRIEIGDQVQEQLNKLVESVSRLDTVDQKITAAVEGLKGIGAETGKPLQELGVNFEQAAQKADAFGNQIGQVTSKVIEEVRKFDNLEPSSPIEPVKVEQDAEEISEDLDELTKKIQDFFDGGFDSTNFEDRVKQVEISISKLSGETNTRLEVVGKSFLKVGDQMGKFGEETGKVVSRAISNLQSLRVESEKLAATPLTREDQLRKLEQERQIVDQLKITIRELASESQESFRSIGDSIKNNLNPAQIRQLPAALRELNSEAKQSEGILGNLTDKFSSLGNVGRFVFGSVLGISAITILRNIIGFFRQANEAASNFIQSIFRLEVAVRGLQRSGLDVTILQYKDNIIELGEQFRIFSRKELANAQARLTVFLRNFGFGFDEIQQALEAALIISEVTGERLIDVVNRLQTAIGTGRFQGIRNLGINLDESVIRKLVDAERELGNISDEGTRAARALQVLNVVTEQIGDIAPDAARIAETLPGALQESEAAAEDLETTLGQMFAPVLFNINKAKTSLFTFIDEISEKVALSDMKIYAERRALVETYKLILSGVIDKEQFSLVLASQTVAEYEKLAKISGRTDLLGDIDPGSVEQSENVTSEILSQWQELWDKLLDEKAKFDASMEDLSIKHSEKLVDIEIRKNQRIEDENTRFFRKLEDIGGEALREFVESGRDLSELEFDISGDDIVLSLKNMEDEFILLGKIGGDALKDIQDAGDDLEDKLDEIRDKLASSLASLTRKLSDDIAKAGRQANDKRASAEEKFRLNEIKAERKFQEDMRRLREEFIFDLEDALRERDARQVLRLTRRFRLDQGQLKRQADLDAQTRKDAFRLQLAEIQKQREIRIRELQIEAAARRRELIQQAKERRALLEAETKDRIAQILAEAQAEIDAEAGLHQQKLDDIELRQTRETEAENLANERRIAALQRNSEDRLEVYRAELEAIVKIAGEVAEVRAQILAQIRSIFDAFGGTFGIKGARAAATGRGGSGFAEGGTAFADQPTNLMFGEDGAEMATLTPLTRPQSTRNLVRGTRDGRGSSDKMQIELLLSPDLQARVINKALQQSAEVFISEIQKR